MLTYSRNLTAEHQENIKANRSQVLVLSLLDVQILIVKLCRHLRLHRQATFNQHSSSKVSTTYQVPRDMKSLDTSGFNNGRNQPLNKQVTTEQLYKDKCCRRLDTVCTSVLSSQLGAETSFLKSLTNRPRLRCQPATNQAQKIGAF